MRELTVERYQSKRKKPGVTARYRAKRKRAESPVVKRVRAKCVERDGQCRVETAGYEHMFAEAHVGGDVLVDLREAHLCDGPPEWAHLGEKKRAKTRGMKPHDRHTTAGSLILCRSHHDRYDGRATPRIAIQPLTERGADGQLVIEVAER